MRPTLSRDLGRTLALLLVGTGVLEFSLVTPTASARFDVTPLTEAQATQRLVHATVQVLALGCDLSLRQGTAAVISAPVPPGRVQLLTNRHVVGTFRSLDVVIDGVPAITPSVLSVSATADVASLVAGDLPSIEGLTLSPYDPLPGDPVEFAGYPHQPGPGALADGLTITHATVVDYLPGASVGEPGKVMRLDAGASPGASGGPVLDRAGDLAGLVFAVQSPTDDTLAIPASTLRRLLGSQSPQAPTGC